MNENNVYFYIPIILRVIVLALVVFVALSFSDMDGKAKLKTTALIVGLYTLIEILVVIAQRYKDVFCQCDKVIVQNDVDILSTI
ncbi:unnamed protein product [marine sediment metagenome]|uniref:Uncharacterized protein n=1 Tax=marine sediment metagenome TaxID=412755 RepID=X1DZ47_9ZZZZ